MGSMIYPIIILSILAIIYGILRWKGINMFSFLNGSVMDMFKIAGMIGAIIEVLSLSELAIARNVNPITAYGRYSMLALVETLLGFWFITAMTESFYEKLKDGYVTIYEVCKTILGVSWIFYLSYFITGNIWITYLESQGRVELQQAYISLLNSARSIHIETNADKFEFASVNPAGIEYGAWGSIYISVLFNFLAMPYLLRKHWQQFRIVDPKGFLGRSLYSIDFLYKNTPAFITPEDLKKMEAEDIKFKGKVKITPAKETKETKEAAPSTLKSNKYFSDILGNGSALADYIEFLKSIYNINPLTFKQYTYEYCGRNFDTGTNLVTSFTSSQVTDNSMTSDEVLKKLTGDLINKPNYGLKELYNKARNLENEINSVEKMRELMSLSEVEIDNTTDKAIRQIKIGEWTIEHDKYKTFVTKLDGIYNLFKNASSPFANMLKSMNFPETVDASKTPFDNSYNMIKSYVKTTKV